MSSPLPSWLSGSYRQYKKDTNSIASWLAQTATEHGYADANIPSGGACNEKKPRSNTKSAKKSGRAKTKKAEGVRKYIISSQDFVKLSEYIVNSARVSVEIPHDLISTIRRVIKARKLSNAFFQQQGDEDSSDDCGHSYFITILEHVLQILEPLCDHATPQAQVDKAESREKTLQNVFSSLTIEEPSEEFLQTPATDKKTSQSRVEFEAEALDGAMLLSFAVYCLFSDLNNIRTFLRTVWEDNEAGKVDLITAAVTTNTAIDLVRRIGEEFERDFPEQKKFEDLVSLFYGIQCMSRGHDPAFRAMADDPFNLACYDVADWLFLPAYAQLKGFAALVQPHHLYVYKPGHFGTYDPCSDRKVKSDREKYQEDRIILLEVLGDFCFVAHMTDEIPAQDELTRGLRRLMTDKEIPLWLVFAAQNFLDIHSIFRQHVGKAFVELKETGRQAKQTIEKNLEFHRSVTNPNWTSHNDVGLRRLVTFIEEWSQEDAVAKSMDEIFKKYPGPHSPHVPSDYHLLRQHPLLCGLSCFSIRIQVQEASIHFANAFGSIMYSGHLYNAVRNESVCDLYWSEMEQLFDFHTPEQFFAGQPPKQVFAYMKQFQICMGEAESSFGRRGTVLSRSGPKVLDAASPVLESFKARYCDNANELDLNLALVERILNQRCNIIGDGEEIESGDEQAEQGRPEATSKPNAPPRAKGGKKSRRNKKIRTCQRAIRSRFHKTKDLSPLALLLALQLSIENELPGLHFDYFAFHRKCWSLLRAVRSSAHSQLLQLSPHYLEGEHQLPFVVGYIFNIALGSERVVEAMGIRTRRAGGVRTGSKALVTAGKAMETFLADET